MYDGASPCSALYVSRHSLNKTRCGDGRLGKPMKAVPQHVLDMILLLGADVLLCSSQTAAGQVDSVAFV